VAALTRLPYRFEAPEALFKSPPLSLIPPADRLLSLAVIASILVHFAVLATTFISAGSKPPPAAAQSLEVVLINARTTQAPSKADVRAQANLDGGGNTDERRRIKTPLPSGKANAEAADQVAAAQARVQQLEAETQRMLAQMRSKLPVESREPNPAQQPAPPSPTVPSVNSAELAARSLEMARLTAQISQDSDAYQKRPRRQFIGAQAQEYRFARYVEDWRAKIERVGNINYPDEARRQKLYGTLLLTVAIKRDGSVESIQVNRSSGFKVLDQAAIRIVELAAPFAAFPTDIAKDTAILEIVRTWSFTAGDQFQGQ
jgi:protein TonB